MFLELKQNVIFQDLIKSNKKINDEYISKNLNAFLSHYFTNENAQYLYEYKIYRFKDKKLYNNQYNLSKHNDLLDLNFVICKLLDYSSINLSKDFFNKQFVDMIENKKNLIFVEFNNESYLLEIKNPNTKSKNNIDTIRSIKSKELFNVINTKNREDFMVDLKTKYFKLIDNKKEFVLNNKIYNIDNILDINLIKMVLFGTLTKQNSNPNYNVSDKKLKSLVQSMSLDDFKSFITNPHVLDVILLNEYFEEHKTTLIENNKMLWYKEYYSRIMQLVSAYYMQKDQSQIDQLINEETNKQIENLYKDNKNKLYYKIRYFEFNHEMEASDFYNDLLDNKKINLDYYTYKDISDMMFLPFIDYSKLENMSFKYKIASKIQDEIKSKINYNKKQIPYNDLLELNDKFYIFQIYDIATVEDLDNLFDFLKEYNKYIISAKTNEQIATKIIQSYKEEKLV